MIRFSPAVSYTQKQIAFGQNPQKDAAKIPAALLSKINAELDTLPGDYLDHKGEFLGSRCQDFVKIEKDQGGVLSDREPYQGRGALLFTIGQRGDYVSDHKLYPQTQYVLNLDSGKLYYRSYSSSMQTYEQFLPAPALPFMAERLQPILEGILSKTGEYGKRRSLYA